MYFLYFCAFSTKLLRLSINNKRVYYVLHSTFCHFGITEVTVHSEILK